MLYETYFPGAGIAIMEKNAIENYLHKTVREKKNYVKKHYDATTHAWVVDNVRNDPCAS